MSDSWAQFHKGQEVRFRAAGGWVRGHISETYENSVSVVHSRGAQQLNTRVYDIRNIEPCQSTKEKKLSMSPENPSFEL